MTRHRARLVAGLAMIALVSGCAGTKPAAGPSYPAARPVGVQDPAVVPSSSASAQSRPSVNGTPATDRSR